MKTARQDRWAWLPRMDERGIVIAFIQFLILLVVLPIFWLMFNELVMPFFGSGMFTGVFTESTGTTGPILWMLWRIVPVFWLIGGVVYMIKESHNMSR